MGDFTTADRVVANGKMRRRLADSAVLTGPLTGYDLDGWSGVISGQHWPPCLWPAQECLPLPNSAQILLPRAMDRQEPRGLLNGIRNCRSLRSGKQP
jgi:hypothetical protein